MLREGYQEGLKAHRCAASPSQPPRSALVRPARPSDIVPNLVETLSRILRDHRSVNIRGPWASAFETAPPPCAPRPRNALAAPLPGHGGARLTGRGGCPRREAAAALRRQIEVETAAASEQKSLRSQAR